MNGTGTIEEISGLDDIQYRVTLVDPNGVPLTSGTATMSLCALGTVLPLGGLAASSQPLTHVGGGVWEAVHDLTNVAAAIASVPIGALFVRCLSITGLATRQLATCRRVRVLIGNGAQGAAC